MTVSAQQWKLGVDGGRIRSAIDPLARESESVVTGLGYDDPITAFRISTGVPTESGSPYWGALAAWRRLAAKKSGFVGGVDVSGHGFAFQSRQQSTSPSNVFNRVMMVSTSGHAAAGQAMPVIGFETDAFQLQARAGVSVYNASTQGQTHDRVVRLADGQLTYQPTPSIAVMPVVRRFAARNESPATFAGASTVVAQGRVSAWGSLGQWLDGADTSTSGQAIWSAGGQLRLSHRASVNATTRHDGYDPLYLNPPQTSWSVGLSILLGKAKSPREPVPAAYEKGVATIRLSADLFPSPPRLAGDFNKWTPVPMERDGSFWTYRVAAQPGVYNYAFVAPDGTWYVPERVPGRKDDGMGGQVAVLVIR
jgi:hypothetical protein